MMGFPPNTCTGLQAGLGCWGGRDDGCCVYMGCVCEIGMEVVMFVSLGHDSIEPRGDASAGAADRVRGTNSDNPSSTLVCSR
jgi:hypothetical protein